MHIMFSGTSRGCTDYLKEQAIEGLRRAMRKNHTIIVGDNKYGIDRVIVDELNATNYHRAFCYGVADEPRNGGIVNDWLTLESSYVQVETPNITVPRYRYAHRDRVMCDNADMGVFIWDGKSKGTKRAYDYMETIKPDNVYLIMET